MREWLGLPQIASAHGADVDHIIVLIHLLMGAMFVGWLALLNRLRIEGKEDMSASGLSWASAAIDT